MTLLLSINDLTVKILKDFQTKVNFPTHLQNT